MFTVELPRNPYKAAMKLVKPLGEKLDWWTTLGTADEAGYTIGNVFRPWHSPEEAEAWQRLHPGTMNSDTVDNVLALCQGRPDWMKDVGRILSDLVLHHVSWREWNDPVWNPGGIGLRWVQQWPWDAKRLIWIMPDGHGWGAHPAFIPWADVPVIGEPIALDAWNRARPRSPLTVPWLPLARAQLIALAMFGGGYWDEAIV